MLRELVVTVRGAPRYKLNSLVSFNVDIGDGSTMAHSSNGNNCNQAGGPGGTILVTTCAYATCRFYPLGWANLIACP